MRLSTDSIPETAAKAESSSLPSRQARTQTLFAPLVPRHPIGPRVTAAPEPMDCKYRGERFALAFCCGARSTPTTIA